MKSLPKEILFLLLFQFYRPHYLEFNRRKIKSIEITSTGQIFPLRRKCIHIQVIIQDLKQQLPFSNTSLQPSEQFWKDPFNGNMQNDSADHQVQLCLVNPMANANMLSGFSQA